MAGRPRWTAWGALLFQLTVVVIAGATAQMTSAAVTSACPPGRVYDAAVQQCCTPCPAGFGVALPCAAGNDTVCAPCAAGKEYSPAASHLRPCDYCAQCPPNARRTHACNATHNTRCRCEPGYYGRAIDDRRMMCVACSVCPAGFYTARKCDHLRDTVCERCPTGTYSPAPGAAHCRPCRACNDGVSKPCTSEHDTICNGSPLVPKTDRRSRAVNASGDMNLVPLYCFILGSIFIGLVIYVILKRLNVCSGGRKAAGAQSGNGGGAPVKSATCTQLLPSAVRTPSADELSNQRLAAGGVYYGPSAGYEARPTHANRHGSVNSSPTKRDDADVRLLQASGEHNNNSVGGKLSPEALARLQQLVAPATAPGDQPLWSALAVRLGYDSAFARACVDAAAQTGRPPADVFLERWNGSPSAAAGDGLARMLRALRAVGRPDVADALCRDAAGIVTV